jgi:tetratricopeptide (TPR) repeat protein
MHIFRILAFLFFYTLQSHAQFYSVEGLYQHLKSTNDYVLQHHLIEQSAGLTSQKCDYLKDLEILIGEDDELQIASAIILLLKNRMCDVSDFQQKKNSQDKVLSLIRSSKDPCFEAFILSRMALGKQSQVPYASNIDYLKDTKLFIEQKGCKQYLYVVPEVEHIILSKQGKSDLALKNILEAEVLYKKYANLHGIGWVHLQKNIGLLFYQTKNYPIALKHWNEGLKSLEKLSLRIRTLIGLNNDVGLAYKSLKNYDQAFIHFSKAIEIAKEIKDSVWIGIPQGNIADIFIE